MSRKTEAMLVLPFEFRYSDKGQFKTEFAIRLKAPTLSDFAVHNKMTAYATEAVRNAQRDELMMMAGAGDVLDKLIKARGDVERETPSEPKEETDEERAARVGNLFASGLGEKYPAFMEFLKKSLTTNARLAAVGESTVGLTDEVWASISDKGGMDGINLVLMTFAGFFLREPQSMSTKDAGGSSRTSSLSDRAAPLN